MGFRHHGLPLFIVFCQAAALGTVQKLVDPFLNMFLPAVEFHTLKHGVLAAVHQPDVDHGYLQSSIIFLGKLAAQKAFHQRMLSPYHCQESFDLVVSNGLQLQACASPDSSVQ